MSQTETLRSIVAKLAGTSPGAVTSDFSLEVPSLKGSLKRAALTASIRRELGITCKTAHLARTFADLQSAVFENLPPTVKPTGLPTPVRPESEPSQTLTAEGVSPKGGSLQVPLQCGVDLEATTALPEAGDYREHEFYQTHFTPAEISYCVLQQDPRMHFAARWCAKEALYKAEPALRDVPFSEIELTKLQDGSVALHRIHNGIVEPLPHAVSISHTPSHAVALVVKAPSSISVPIGVSHYTSEPAQTQTEGSILPFLSAIAWLAAVALSIAALIRSAR
ncbi:holo-ACP synthase [Horticoccus sp. 23ND18S-11]|uniref:holo-ACP synthase n=1 Tax=Horticoccus sp. 23ND18S-11 TaxID=3391832 RepID=UPI0039C9D045